MNTDALTESVLVCRAKTEPRAFADLYDHYFPRVYNYIRYHVRDAETADDITAQVFERALIKISSYRPERASFADWLFAIARNAVRDHSIFAVRSAAAGFHWRLSTAWPVMILSRMRS